MYVKAISFKWEKTACLPHILGIVYFKHRIIKARTGIQTCTHFIDISTCFIFHNERPSKLTHKIILLVKCYEQETDLYVSSLMMGNKTCWNINEGCINSNSCM